MFRRRPSACRIALLIGDFRISSAIFGVGGCSVLRRFGCSGSGVGGGSNRRSVRGTDCRVCRAFHLSSAQLPSAVPKKFMAAEMNAATSLPAPPSPLRFPCRPPGRPAGHCRTSRPRWAGSVGLSAALAQRTPNPARTASHCLAKNLCDTGSVGANASNPWNAPSTTSTSHGTPAAFSRCA